MENYGIRFIAEYKNKKGEVISIRIGKKGHTSAYGFPYTFTFEFGAGAETGGNGAGLDRATWITSPASLRYREQEGNPIVGSELSFAFSTKDKTPFLELFESNYKDYVAELFINNIKQWSGWLVVDNINTSYFDYVYNIELSFNDGLAELDRHEVTNDAGGEVTGQNSLLWYIKNSLKHNGIPLEFAVRLNIKETNLMPLETDNALAMGMISAERWKNKRQGKKEIDKAKKVISEILKPFFPCRIYQAQNRYFIVNEFETNSAIYYYAWADLAPVSKSTHNNTVDITTRLFAPGNDLTKKRPKKYINLKYRNKNIPSNLVTVNPDFSTTDASFWARTSPFQGVFGVIENELRNTTTDINGGDCQGTEILSDAISIEQKAVTDIIQVQFDYYLKDITFINAGNTALPYLTVELIYQDGTKQTDSLNVLGTGKATFYREFANKGTGTYTIKIIDSANSTATYSLIEFRIDNISVFAVKEDGTHSVVTFDKHYSALNTGTTAIDFEEIDVLIGDGMQINDIGNISVGGTLTKAWKTVSRAENVNLQHLYAINLLRYNQKFRNRLRLSVMATDFARIAFFNTIQFDTKKYSFFDYTLTYKVNHNEYALTLLEIPPDDITYELSASDLTSVNGKDTD